MLVIFDDGFLLEQELCKVYHGVASTCIAYFLIALAESLDKLLTPHAVRFAKCDLQSLTVLLLVKRREWSRAFTLAHFELMVLYQIWQSIRSYLKGERSKLLVSDMHCLHLTDIPVLNTFRDLKHGLRLVVQFRSYMTTGVVITLVEMENGMDMQLIVAGPTHQLIDDVE